MVLDPKLAGPIWSASNVWMEFSNQTRPDSVSARKYYKLGENLLSKTTGAGGADNYAFMRELRPGDPVIHVVKTTETPWEIVGTSVVKQKYAKRRGVDGEESYSVALKNFIDFRESKDALDLTGLMAVYKEEIRRDILENSPPLYPFVQRKGVLTVAERYVSLASREFLSCLLEMWADGVEYQNVRGVESDINEIRRKALAEGTKATTVNRLIDARLGQGRFRSDLETAWNGQCAVLGLSTRALLRASHIKPWSQSTDKERLDPENGILLTAHLDALFDNGLISFDDDGAIVLSRDIDIEERKLLKLDGCVLKKIPSSAMKRYLSYHREKFGL